ncbi:MAG: hypothetical protein LBI74_09420 [Synergistaceae bacterium]|jgi:hypothetical protein|nr:hypothetical protein [Synergistaceae bacterium]
MADFIDFFIAEQYLEHKYHKPERMDLPLPDEDFALEWAAWLEGRNGGFPKEARPLLSSLGTRAWIEATPAGRIPAVYTEDRQTFERLIAILSLDNDDEGGLPASVNAFTVPCRCPGFEDHRVILLHKSGYSLLPPWSVGLGDDEWLEKSFVLRLHHECCHYFTLRVLGGMKTHALDEIIADCAGQLAALGRYDASLQRKFFGLEDRERIAPGGRLGFYVRNLSKGATYAVCRKVNEALDGLEGYLEKNAEMAHISRRPELIVKLAALGLPGIAELR